MQSGSDFQADTTFNRKTARTSPHLLQSRHIREKAVKFADYSTLTIAPPFFAA
jgi:hypothetical protein